jgi:hypothetical protein
LRLEAIPLPTSDGWREGMRVQATALGDLWDERNAAWADDICRGTLELDASIDGATLPAARADRTRHAVADPGHSRAP